MADTEALTLAGGQVAYFRQGRGSGTFEEQPGRGAQPQVDPAKIIN